VLTLEVTEHCFDNGSPELTLNPPTTSNHCRQAKQRRKARQTGKLLPGDICVKAMVTADKWFVARFNCKGYNNPDWKRSITMANKEVREKVNLLRLIKFIATGEQIYYKQR